MDRTHFAAVERAVAGLMKCSVSENGVRCLLLNSWPALTMEDPRTVVEPGRVTRSWSISGGGLARPAARGGSITFGWEGTPDRPGEQALWVRVEGYPSRFLPADGRGGPLRRALADFYGAYHGRVTRNYLMRMASALASGLEASE